jgi:hypothetical protein
MQMSGEERVGPVPCLRDERPARRQAGAALGFTNGGFDVRDLGQADEIDPFDGTEGGRAPIAFRGPRA